MATVSRTFALGDVISAVCGTLVSRRGIDAVYDVLNFMTGDSLYTHQLPRAGREARPHVLRQHPWFADIDVSKVTPKNWRQWLARWEKQYGATMTLSPIPQHEYEATDPLLELASMMDKPIVVVKQE